MFGQQVENKVDVKKVSFGSSQYGSKTDTSIDLPSKSFDWRDYEWWIADGVILVLVIGFIWWTMRPGKAIEKEPRPIDFVTERTIPDKSSSSREQVKEVPHNRILSDGFH